MGKSCSNVFMTFIYFISYVGCFLLLSDSILYNIQVFAEWWVDYGVYSTLMGYNYIHKNTNDNNLLVKTNIRIF